MKTRHHITIRIPVLVESQAGHIWQVWPDLPEGWQPDEYADVEEQGQLKTAVLEQERAALDEEVEKRADDIQRVRDFECGPV